MTARWKGTRRDAPAVRSWWGLKWIALLRSFGWEMRPPGGRAVSREGEVLSMDVGRDGVKAVVRGPAQRRYEVRLKLKPLPARAFDKAIRAMAGEARFAASLLSGLLPDDIEEAFKGTGRTLLPQRPDELTLTCTCPEERDLCKHRAAVCRLLAGRFDRDPFLIFLLRGKGRDDLLKALQRHRSTRPALERSAELASRSVEPAQPLPTAVLLRPELFFKPLLPVASLRTTFAPAEHLEAILTRLGPPPLSDPDASRLLVDLHRAVGLGAAERLAEWEWRRVSPPRASSAPDKGRGRAALHSGEEF